MWVRILDSTTCWRQLVHRAHAYHQAIRPNPYSESVTMDFWRIERRTFPTALYSSRKTCLWEAVLRAFNHIKEHTITKGTERSASIAMCTSQYHWPVVSYVGVGASIGDDTAGLDMLLYPGANGLGTWMPPISARGMKDSIGRKYNVRIEHPQHIAQPCNADMGADFSSSRSSSSENGMLDKSVACNSNRWYGGSMPTQAMPK